MMGGHQMSLSPAAAAGGGTLIMTWWLCSFTVPGCGGTVGLIASVARVQLHPCLAWNRILGLGGAWPLGSLRLVQL